MNEGSVTVRKLSQIWELVQSFPSGIIGLLNIYVGDKYARQSYSKRFGGILLPHESGTILRKTYPCNTPENLLKIAKALGITVSDILGDVVREPEGKYEPLPANPRAAILADYQAPEGLRDLAQDKALIDALKITPKEWRALASLKSSAPLTKEGYVQVLFALRSGGQKDRVSVT